MGRPARPRSSRSHPMTFLVPTRTRRNLARSYGGDAGARVDVHLREAQRALSPTDPVVDHTQHFPLRLHASPRPSKHQKLPSWSSKVTAKSPIADVNATFWFLFMCGVKKMVLSPLNRRAELSSPMLYLYKADYTQPPATTFPSPVSTQEEMERLFSWHVVNGL